jgi:hypothetical protein
MAGRFAARFHSCQDRKDSTVKRAVAALGAIFIAGAACAPAFASTTEQGAVKFGWTVPASFTAHLASDYKTAQAAFATGTGTIQTSTSAGSGTCTTPATDAFNSFALTFGTITPGTGSTGCNYQNAIGMSVNTNDANGYNIYETLDVTSAPSNYGVCIFTDGATATATTPASTQGTAPAAATFNASNVATACGGTGTLLGPASGTVTNPGVGGDASLTPTGANASTVPSTGAIFTVAAGTPATGTNFYGEDVQLNIPSSAPSVTNAAHAVIIYFVPG